MCSRSESESDDDADVEGNFLWFPFNLGHPQGPLPTATLGEAIRTGTPDVSDRCTNSLFSRFPVAHALWWMRHLLEHPEFEHMHVEIKRCLAEIPATGRC